VPYVAVAGAALACTVLTNCAASDAWHAMHSSSPPYASGLVFGGTLQTTGDAWAAVYLSALGFALLHTPNPTLMLATFIGGLCWCSIWLRYRALLPLALSHAISALLLSSLLPADILHSAEVSARFFQ